VHAVSLEGRIVSVLYTLVTGSHWMCWLAAQTAEGRAIAASYRAYDALLADAHAAGVAAVNLGVSVGGGSEFKHHLGAREAQMREWSRERVTRSAVRVMRQFAARAVSGAKAVHGRAS
jgi:CelD/BcsL family acetyltransferase involved in cellulose biosynthesis